MPQATSSATTADPATNAPGRSRFAAQGLGPAAAAVVFACLYGQYLAGWSPSGGDVVNQYLPYQQLIREAVRAGHWPLWNALTFCGRPLMGDIQVGVLYPPNWLHWLLPLPLSFALVLALHGAWMVAGCWKLGRHWRLAPPATLLGTVLYAASPFFLLKMSQGIILFIYVGAWWPWLALAASRLVQRPGLPRMAALTVTLLLSLLAGSPQITFYGWIAALALALAIPASQSESRKSKSQKSESQKSGRASPSDLRPSDLRPSDLRPSDLRPSDLRLSDPPPSDFRLSDFLTFGLRRLAWLGLAFAFAAGLSAVQTLQTAGFIGSSFERATGASWDYVTDGSLAPRLFWLMLNPGLLGKGTDLGYYWGGRTDFAESCDYLPLWLPAIVLPLALAWLLRRGDRPDRPDRPDRIDPRERLHRRLAWLALAAMALGLALAPGASSPLFKWFFHLVPGFNRFRVPARLMTFYLAGAALLAALVWDRVLRSERPLAARACAVAGAAAALAATWLAYSLRDTLWTALADPFVVTTRLVPPEVTAALDWEVLRFALRASVFVLAAGGAFWIVAGRRGRAGAAAWAPAALALAELAWLALPFRADTPWARYHDAFYPRTALVQALQQNHRGGRILSLDDVFQYRVGQDAMQLYPELYANRLAMQSLPDARGYDPVNARWLGEWMNLLSGRDPASNPHGFMFVNRIDRPGWLALMAVESVLSYQDLSEIPGLRAAAEFPFRGGTLRLWRNERFGGMGFAAPRPPVVPEAPPPQWRADLFASARLAEDPAADPRSLVTIDPFTAGELQGLTLADKVDDRFQVQPLPSPPGQFRFHVDYPQAALLGLAQSAYDGWEARLDGRPAAALIVSGAFLAAAVPAGSHEVTFQYAPTSFTFGAIVSLATLLALLYALARRRFVRRAR